MTRRPLLVGAIVLTVLTVTDVAPPIRLSPALRLRMTVSVNGACPGVESVGVGSATSVTYCYTVTNTGSTPARGIVLTDARGSVRVGTLRGGQSLTVARTIPLTPDVGWVAEAPDLATATHEAIGGVAEAASADAVTPELSLTATARDASLADGVSGAAFLASPAPAPTLQSP